MSIGPIYESLKRITDISETIKNMELRNNDKRTWKRRNATTDEYIALNEENSLNQ